MLVRKVQSESVGAWVDRGWLVLSWLPCVSLSESSRYFPRDLEAPAFAFASSELLSGRSVDVFQVMRRPVRRLWESGFRSESVDERFVRVAMRLQPFEVRIK